MALYNRLHIWVSNEILTASDLNAEFNNILTNANAAALIGASANVSAMQTVADPGGVGTESLAASVTDELERLRFVVKRLAGQSQWYVAPLGSLSTGGIVTANLAAKAVDATKIADATITTTQISSTAGILGSQLDAAAAIAQTQLVVPDFVYSSGNRINTVGTMTSDTFDAKSRPFIAIITTTVVAGVGGNGTYTISENISGKTATITCTDSETKSFTLSFGLGGQGVLNFSPSLSVSGSPAPTVFNVTTTTTVFGL